MTAAAIAASSAREILFLNSRYGIRLKKGLTSLLSNVHDQLQTMLNRLRVYAHRESLTVNTNKSEVMCFNSRSDNRLSPLYYDSTQLSYPNTFKYLGMVRDKNINLTTAADAALRHFMAALSE